MRIENALLTPPAFDVLPFLRGFAGHGPASPGDWGQPPSGNFSGAWYQAPCWPNPSTQCNITLNNYSLHDLKKNKSKTRKNAILHKQRHTLQIFLTHLSLSLLITSCGSAELRRQAIADNFSNQRDGIRKIELQRREPKLLRKVRRDEALWRAEASLLEELKALRESSHAMSLFFKTDNKKEEK